MTMDWPKARVILLAAFTVVNFILAYSVWGPTGVFGQGATPHQEQVQQVRATLLERGFELQAAVPRTPGPLSFLRVEYSPTLEFPHPYSEPSGRDMAQYAIIEPRAFDRWTSHLEPSVDIQTQAILYYPRATGTAAGPLDLTDRSSLVLTAREYLRGEQLLPAGAQFTGVFAKGDSENLLVEYVPVYQGYPVYSGFVRAEVSSRGIETVTHFWVRPQGFQGGAAKAVRPAAEVLLRLAGHLERTNSQRRTITEISLGFYAGRSLTALQSGVINGWDTVPVWRIGLDNGEVFFINAFNGELES